MALFAWPLPWSGSRAVRAAARGKHSRPPEPQQRPRRFPWRALGLLLVLPALVVLGAGAIVVTYAFASVPLPNDLDLAPTVVYDVRGEEIGELQRQASREDVDLGDLPEHVIDAVLAAEDADFYRHSGVSIPGIVRAAYTNVVHGEIRQGGSTISQQYVKNLTGQQDDTFVRKINEAALAVKLERRFDKEEILELYLNSIYFGRGAYGIQAAARAYFAVDADQLSPEQAALLAGILPAPSSLDPERDPAGAEQRYAYVLDRLSAEGWVSSEELRRMQGSVPAVEPSRVIVSRRAPFFLAMVEQELASELGAAAVHRGLAVRTSLDLRVQDAAERAYREAFGELDSSGGSTVPTGAIVALDPETGGIRALVGGPDYASDQFNLATGGPEGVGRQPGSTFKPFGLAAWIEQGYSPESPVEAPARLVLSAEELGTAEDWELENFGGADLGRVTVREATWQSSNTAYAQLGVDIGLDRVLDLARRAGLDPDRELRPEPALVLGTGEVTPLALAEAYNTFASGGMRREATSILEVSRDGQRLVSADTEGERAFDEDVAYEVSAVLQGVLESGTGTAARIDRPAAGKTGTTSNHADAWFAGYTPDLTAVVWMGHRDDNQPMADAPTGGGLPASLWGAFVQQALDGVDPTPFPEPGGDLRMRGGPTECPDGEVLTHADPDDPDSRRVCVTEEPPDEPPEPETREEQGPEPADEPSEEPTDEPTAEPEPVPTEEPADEADPEPRPEEEPPPSQPPGEDEDTGEDEDPGKDEEPDDESDAGNEQDAEEQGSDGRGTGDQDEGAGAQQEDVGGGGPGASGDHGRGGRNRD